METIAQFNEPTREQLQSAEESGGESIAAETAPKFAFPVQPGKHADQDLYPVFQPLETHEGAASEEHLKESKAHVRHTSRQDKSQKPTRSLGELTPDQIQFLKKQSEQYPQLRIPGIHQEFPSEVGKETIQVREERYEVREETNYPIDVMLPQSTQVMFPPDYIPSATIPYEFSQDPDQDQKKVFELESQIQALETQIGRLSDSLLDTRRQHAIHAALKQKNESLLEAMYTLVSRDELALRNKENEKYALIQKEAELEQQRKQVHQQVLSLESERMEHQAKLLGNQEIVKELEKRITDHNLGVLQNHSKFTLQSLHRQELLVRLLLIRQTIASSELLKAPPPLLHPEFICEVSVPAENVQERIELLSRGQAKSVVSPEELPSELEIQSVPPPQMIDVIDPVFGGVFEGMENKITEQHDSCTVVYQENPFEYKEEIKRSYSADDKESEKTHLERKSEQRVASEGSRSLNTSAEKLRTQKNITSPKEPQSSIKTEDVNKDPITSKPTWSQMVQKNIAKDLHK